MTFKVAFFDSKPYDKTSFLNANKKFGYDLEFFEPKLNMQTVRLAKGFSAVCAFVNDTLSASVINKLYEYGVRLIVMRCAGYNNIDFKAAYNKINVVRVPAYSPNAVAEHAMALLLCLTRKIHRAFNRTREGNFSLNGLMGVDMYGQTAGIIGTGKIAKCFISILKGFGINIIAYDPFPDKAYAAANKISYTSLDELFKKSDIISLHCPLSKDNIHLIDKNAIGLMKKNCIIINTGRGKLIDSKALIDALVEGRIAGACLDVYEEESNYFFEDKSDTPITDAMLARLIGLPNVLLTSHQGFFTKEALDNIVQTSLLNIREFVSGDSLTNEICYKCNTGECVKSRNGRCF